MSKTVAQAARPACLLMALATGAGVSAAERPVLEEVVVTATLRQSNLQSTPLSVSAVTGETLESMNAAQISDFYRSVPGLFVMDRGPTDKKFVIRGVQNSVISGGNTVGLYLDDMPVSLSSIGSTVDLNLFDLERVEVLRGPQGTLYGATSMAGTIKYITRKPELDKFSAAARGDVSSTKSGGMNYAVEGMLNLPLVQDQLALRLVGYHRDSSGYIDKVSPGVAVPAFPGVPADGFFPGSPPVAGHDAYFVPALMKKNANDHTLDGVRGALRWQATDDLTLTATVLHEKSDIDESFSYQPDAGDLKSEVPIHQPRSSENLLSSLVIEYTPGDVSLYSASNYFDASLHLNEQFTGEFPADLTPPGTELLTDVDSRVFTQELRLSSTGDSPFQWLVGAWYFTEDSDVRQVIHRQFDQARKVVDETTPRELRQWALFGEVSYRFADRLTATFGTRFWDVSLDNGPKRVDVDPAIFFLPPRGVQPEIFHFDDQVTTFKYNLSYQLSDDVLIYAQAAQGFRIGGFNVNPTNNPSIPPGYGSDSLWNYEIGAKTSWLDGRVVFNPTIYHIAWSDIQTRVFVNGAGFNGNAGKAHITGLELELTAEPVNGLLLSVAGSLLEAELDEDQPANELFPTGVEGKKGDRLPGVPEFTLTAAAQYDFPLTATLGGSVRVDASYTGASYTEFRAVPPAPDGQYDRLDAYTLVNLSAGVNSDNWDALFYISNLFDQRAEVDILKWPGNFDQVTTNRPRTVGVRLTHRF